MLNDREEDYRLCIVKNNFVAHLKGIFFFLKYLSKNSGISVKKLFLIFFTSSLWSRIKPFKSNLLYLLQSWGIT